MPRPKPGLLATETGQGWPFREGALASDIARVDDAAEDRHQQQDRIRRLDKAMANVRDDEATRHSINSPRPWHKCENKHWLV